MADEEEDCLRITATVMETELLHRWLRGWGEQIRDVVSRRYEFPAARIDARFAANVSPCGEYRHNLRMNGGD
ncbi:hypothetical protein [Azovibrio restrictus]|uniref:hypothetical protein n=1 Tax=Azovibrio restrictus TaxID=146938 RepID=UPI0026F2584F|nr:hypothetical protein [Azovibrio restrictus]